MFTFVAENNMTKTLIMTRKLQIVTFLTAIALFTTSCVSTTLIQSEPSGATVYIENQKVGTTPYSYSDTKVSGSVTEIKLKKEGYEDFNVSMVRNERADAGAIIGGIFFLFPFIWTMGYDPAHNYELQPAITDQVSGIEKKVEITTANETASNSTNELIKLKNLLDQQAITSDDFTTLKVKILNNEYDYSNSIADQIYKLRELYNSNLLTKEEYSSQVNKLVNSK